MIIVSKLHYDVLSIKWTTTNKDATIETEKEKIIEEYGLPYMEKQNENIIGVELKYDSWNSIIITEC